MFDNSSFESHFYLVLSNLEHWCTSYLVHFVWSVHDIFLDAFLNICGVMNLFSSLKRKIEFHLKQLHVKTLLLFSAYNYRYSANHSLSFRLYHGNSNLYLLYLWTISSKGCMVDNGNFSQQTVTTVHSNVISKRSLVIAKEQSISAIAKTGTVQRTVVLLPVWNSPVL